MKKTANKNDHTSVESWCVCACNGADWPSRLSRPEGQEMTERRSSVGKAGRGQRPGSAECGHLPRGKAFHARPPARRARARPAAAPRALPRTGRPRRRLRPASPAPRARPGPAPTSLARSFAQDRGGASSQNVPRTTPRPLSPAARRSHRAKGTGQRPRQRALTLSRFPLVTQQQQVSHSPLAASSSQARPRGWKRQEAWQRAVTSGLLPSPSLFGSVAGSASTPTAIFLKSRRQGLLWAGNDRRRMVFCSFSNFCFVSHLSSKFLKLCPA